jgi:hypothetical protein
MEGCLKRWPSVFGVHSKLPLEIKKDKKKAASTSCLKAMKTIKQCSENRKLETIK